MEIEVRKLMHDSEKFDEHLFMNDKTATTVRKYVRDVKKFIAFLQKKQRDKFGKRDVFDYKDYLITKYKMTTVNSYLISLNLYFSFLNLPELRVKTISIPRKTSLDSILSDDEYLSLIRTAQERGNERLYLIIRTLASTGMRVSELRNITPEVLKEGGTFIRSKNKVRELIIPNHICQELLAYCEKEKIKNLVFHGRNPDRMIDKALIWRELKALAPMSRVPDYKVFPHNFRHYFAKKFLETYNDVMDLAGILGHSSIETARIYTRTSGQEKRSRMNALKL